MLPSDERMRQHMRGVRKMEKEQIRAKIAEHEQAIDRAKQMLAGMQEQANTISTDIMRRQGAVIALRELVGDVAPVAAPEPQPEPLIVQPNGA